MTEHRDTESPAPIVTPEGMEALEPPYISRVHIMGPRHELFAALAKAQGEFKPIERTREVEVTTKDRNGNKTGSYTFDYAPLEEVLAACIPALSANGLALTHYDVEDEQGSTLTTLLTHSSGAMVEKTTRLEFMKQFTRDNGQVVVTRKTRQEIGSEITYVKRYSTECILGVAAGYDDDGNASSGNDVTNMRDRRQPPVPPQKTQAARQPPPQEKRPERPAPQAETRPPTQPPPAAAPQAGPTEPRSAKPDYVVDPPKYTGPGALVPPPIETHGDEKMSPELEQEVAGLFRALGFKRNSASALCVKLFNKTYPEVTLRSEGERLMKHLQEMQANGEVAQ